MRTLMIAIVGMLTMSSIAAQDVSTPDGLETQRAAAEESGQQATAEAQTIATAYRKASKAETPDKQAVDKLKLELTAAVTKAFESQTQLQTIRLQLAENNIQRVRTKLQRREKLSASIITRRVKRMQSGMEVVESDEKNSLRPFESPEALFAEWNRCYILNDAHGIVSLIDDEGVR